MGRTVKLTSLDLNLFVVFEAIYIERNLTRAAEALSVTQPAVSNALARLRALLDDPLFERRGGIMAPTPASQALIGPVRQALARLRSGLDQRVRFDPATSDRIFHIAAREATTAVLLPDLERRLAVEAPGVQIHTHLVERALIPGEMAAGALDFALDIPQLARGDLTGVRLFDDRYVCVLRRDHPAAARPLTLTRFLALRQIAISGRRRGKTLIEAALARTGHEATVTMRLSSYHAAFDIVRQSDLAAAAPYRAAQHAELAIMELPFPPPMLETWLHWRRSADSDPASQWMRGLLTETAAAMAPEGGPARATPRRGRAGGRAR